MAAIRQVATFHIHLLGPPRFFLQQEPFKLAVPEKGLVLLTLLLLQPGPMARDPLAFTLWEGEREEVARGNLRRYIYRLQQGLPKADVPWVVADGDSVTWNPDADIWFDVVEFERAAVAAERHRDAAALYTGDLVEGIYDDCLIKPRERLRQRYVTVMNDLIGECRTVRKHSEAIEFAQTLLRFDPWREDVVRHLMAARYESGDRAGALRDYEALARRLRDEMGAVPMEETVVLRDAIIAGTSLPHQRGATIAGAAEIRGQPGNLTREARVLPFAGRDREVGELRSAWTRAAQGNGGIVFIGGQAGIGKSRLVSELAIHAELQGGRTLWGATTRPETAYQPIAEALRSGLSMLAALKGNPIWLSAVAQIVPDLKLRRSDLPALSKVDATRERLRLFEGLVESLRGLARPRPLLILLEDLQWAGSSTMSAIDYLARSAAAQSILLVGTYRDEETNAGHPLREAMRGLHRDKIATTIVLQPLDLRALSSIIEKLPGWQAHASALAPRLHAVSDGNPLFLGEIIRDATETAGTAEVAASQMMQSEKIQMPGGLKATISSRIERLSAEARSFADVASVVGPSFDVDIVREVAGWDEAQVFTAVDELVDRRIIRDPGRRGSFDYAFSHHLIHETVYSDIDDPERRRRHMRVATVIENAYRDRAGETFAMLAHHFAEGGDRSRAATYFLDAAKAALAVFANDEAVRFSERGKAYAGNNQRLVLDLLKVKEAGDSLRGDRDSQRSDLDELERHAEQVADNDLSCDVLWRRILMLRSLGEREEEGRLAEGLMKRADASGQRKWMARALEARATHALLLSHFSEARDAAQQALKAYGQTGDEAGRFECICLLAEASSSVGTVSETDRLLNEAQALATRQGGMGRLARVTLAATRAAALQQNWERCIRLAQAVLEQYRAMGDREGEADARARLASAQARLLRFADARTNYKIALEAYEAIGKRQGMVAVLLNDGNLSARLGLFDEALASFNSAREICETMGDEYGTAVACVNASVVLAYAERPKEGKVSALRALKIARRLKLKVVEASALGNLGWAERTLGELQKAVAHCEAAMKIRRAIHRPSDYISDIADLAYIYLQAGRVDDATRAIKEYLEADDAAIRFTTFPQLGFWVASLVHAAKGEHDEAKRLALKAREIVRTMSEAMKEPAMREAFSKLWFNREILQA